eukprot:tig00020562_g11143.t1
MYMYYGDLATQENNASTPEVTGNVPDVNRHFGGALAIHAATEPVTIRLGVFDFNSACARTLSTPVPTIKLKAAAYRDRGAAIWTSAPVSISSSVVRENTIGGAVFVKDATATLDAVIFSRANFDSAIL